MLNNPKTLLHSNKNINHFPLRVFIINGNVPWLLAFFVDNYFLHEKIPELNKIRYTISFWYSLIISGLLFLLSLRFQLLFIINFLWNKHENIHTALIYYLFTYGTRVNFLAIHYNICVHVRRTYTRLVIYKRNVFLFQIIFSKKKKMNFYVGNLVYLCIISGVFLVFIILYI